MMIWIILAVIAAITAIFALITMSIIDLRERILPNKLNLLLAVCGIVFHTSLGFALMPPYMMILGALAGGGVLYAIRAVSNHIYGMETLGLGDVKLLAAGGIWLGPQNTMMALSIGALAGLAHGLLYIAYQKIRHREDVAFRGLTIPAGPGFATGLFAVACWHFGIPLI